MGSLLVHFLTQVWPTKPLFSLCEHSLHVSSSSFTSILTLSSSPDFIAGVTNPIFETMPIWDVLCNIETRKITVNKDIRSAPPPPSLFPTPPPLLPRSGTIRSEGSAYDDDVAIGRAPSQRENREPAGGRDFVAKSDSPDNLFMEDVCS